MAENLAAGLVESLGNLPRLMALFRSKGLDCLIDSWVSNEPNLPLFGEQLRNALGVKRVQDLAAAARLREEEWLAAVSVDLPRYIDQLTPEGRVH